MLLFVLMHAYAFKDVHTWRLTNRISSTLLLPHAFNYQTLSAGAFYCWNIAPTSSCPSQNFSYAYHAASVSQWRSKSCFLIILMGKLSHHGQQISSNMIILPNGPVKHQIAPISLFCQSNYSFCSGFPTVLNHMLHADISLKCEILTFHIRLLCF